jgi:hypothetical protein
MAGAEDGFTVEELGRGLTRVERALADGLGEVKRQITGLNVVRVDTYTADKTARDREIREIKDELGRVKSSQGRVVMALFGALLTLTVGIILALVTHGIGVH